MASSSGEGETSGIYSGRAEIRTTAEIFATRRGSSRCEMFVLLRLLDSRAGKMELAPTFKDAPPLTLLGLVEPSNRRTRVSALK